MAQGDELEPGTPLDVARAARLAGCSEVELRARMDEGRLLFEVQRLGGKETQIVRYVDLVDAFPGRFVADVAEPEPEPGPQGWDQASRSVDPPQRPPVEPPGEPRAAESPRDTGSQARLEALQESQRVLQAQLEDLGDQRARLREQGDELRNRLQRVEQERQASTAGLLMMQQRLMELEAGPVMTIEPPAHRRPLVWWAVGSGLVLLMAIQSMRSMRTAFASQTEGLGEVRRALEIESAAAARDRAIAVAEQEAQAEAWARQFARQDERWDQEQERMRGDRDSFAQALQAERASAEALRLAQNEELRLQREGSAAEREQAAKRILELEARAEAAWRRLDEERAEAAAEAERKARAIEERLAGEARARGELGTRLHTVQQELAATAQRALDLESELEQERRISRAQRDIRFAMRHQAGRRKGLSGPVDFLCRRLGLWMADPALFGAQGPLD